MNNSTIPSNGWLTYASGFYTDNQCYRKGQSMKNTPPQSPLTRQPIGYINRQNPIKRIFKAVWLRSTTNYNWKLCWHMAAK
jgi:hypothetical protein